jgi:protein YibB
MMRLFPERFDHLAAAYWLPPDRTPGTDAADLTVVTGYFDIGRSGWRGAVKGHEIPAWMARTNQDYLAHFRLLARLKNEMIVFTEPRFAGEVLAARKDNGLEASTVVMTLDRPFERDPILAATRARIDAAMRNRMRDFVEQPNKPEAFSADYVLVTALKPVLTTAALDLGLVTRRQLAWLDFSYCREPESFNPDYPWRYDCGDRLHVFTIETPDGRTASEMVRTAYCPFHGAQVFGPRALWPRLRGLFEAMLAELLAADLADDDQGLLLMAWRGEPQLFAVHAVPRRDRFCALRLYNSAVPPDQVPPPARRSARSPKRRLLNEVERLMRRLRAS